jgi:hypothetical protein
MRCEQECRAAWSEATHAFHPLHGTRELSNLQLENQSSRNLEI